MPSIVKSVVLGLGLVVCAAVSAQAQSVATLPPNGGQPTTQSAVNQTYGSTQSYFPKPGGTEVIRDAQNPPPAPPVAVIPSDAASRPYSAGLGPKPN